jgi:hypothetical protein
LGVWGLGLKRLKFKIYYLYHNLYSVYYCITVLKKIKSVQPLYKAIGRTANYWKNKKALQTGMQGLGN